MALTTAGAAALALAGAAALVVWLRHRFVLIEVDGPSMRPALVDGDRVLVRRRPLRCVRAGDIVVVARGARPRPDGRQAPVERGRWMIKRAAAVPGDPVPVAVAATAASGVRVPGGLVPDARLLVLGDNAACSFDSRHFGYLTGDGVLGVVVRRVRRGRARERGPRP